MDQLISNVDNIILTFVHGSFGSLTGTIHTLWRLMFIVFIAVYGYKIMVSGRFSTSDLITHCLKIIVLLVLATSWDAFFLFVYRMVTDLPSEIAGQIMQAAASSFGPDAVADNTLTANTALSQFYDRAMSVAAHLLEGAGWNQTGLYFYAFAVWFGAIGFTGYATMLIILSKLAVSLLLAIGPIFILLLIFTDTRKLFEGWLKTLLNYAIIPIFVYALLAILLVLAESPLKYMELHNGVSDQFLTAIGPFLLISFVSILLLAQVMSIATNITGGVSLSTMGGSLWLKDAAKGTSKVTAKATELGWKKSAPARERLVEKVKAGHAALQHALSRNQKAT